MTSKVSYIIQLKDQFGRTAAKVNRQFEKITKNANKAGRSVKSFAKKSQASLGELGRSAAKTGAIMTAAVTVPIALMGQKMIAAASDATETANKFNAVFDDVKGKANKVANDFSKSFGTAGSTARKLIGDTGDLLVGFGFSGDAALEMSKKVNELAADLTSFQNVEGGVDAASSALTKALLGETESAKSLGIVVRQNTKDFRDQVKRISQAKGITQQQAKAVAILKQAQQQSRKAIGDVSRTWDDYASVQRRAAESSKKTAETFGKLLIPLATQLQLWIISISGWLNKLSPGMKKIVLVLTGLVAIGGPLLLVLSGIAIAFSVISLPILLIGAAIAALIVAGVLLAANWKKIVTSAKIIWGQLASFVSDTADKIGEFFSGMWDGLMSGLTNFVNFAIIGINSLLGPLSFVAEKLGLGSIQIKTIESPSAPVQPSSGTINGQIAVSAAPGSKIDSTSMTAKSKGLNLGMNMAAL